MNRAIFCSLLLASLAAEAAGELLVEVSSVEGDDGTTPRDMAALEDAIVAAFNQGGLKVESRRQRVSRIPYSVYIHAEELTACANPTWSRQRVLACVDNLAFPVPTPHPPAFTRVTHLLRLARQRGKAGETLVLSLAPVGSEGKDKVSQRVLPKDATANERRTTALDMAAELLAPLREGKPLLR